MSEGTMDQVLAGEATWCVIEGDCLEVMAGMPDGCVGAVVTDPPYGFGAYSTDREQDLTEVFGDRLAPTRAVFCYPEQLVGWCIDYNRKPDEWINWAAANQVCGRSRGLMQSEAIAVFGPTPGVGRMKRPRPPSVKARGLQDAARSRIGDAWTDAAPGRGFNSHLRLHPNEKPLTLMERLVSLCTDPGDLILDPFAGSGTTGVAALRRGRRVILIEREPKWAELCRERLRAEEQQSDLRSARAGQVALFGGAK